MLLLRGEARFALRGWKDAMNVSLQETSVLKRRLFFFLCHANILNRHMLFVFAYAEKIQLNALKGEQQYIQRDRGPSER